MYYHFKYRPKNIINQFLRTIKENIFDYQTPVNLNYLWNFGSLALFVLVLQIITGLFLACWYVTDINYAFLSVDYIMREVYCGWFFRYMHANGASLFFIVIYIHMLRGFYYGSYTYPRENVWYTGFIIFVLLMGTAFLGYILPWGQMSYWAATVITSLFTAIPYIGDNLVIFLWGGISVGQPMLTRVFTLHYLLPFIVSTVVVLHIYFLHLTGSNNPLGIKNIDTIPFSPYYIIKDILGIFICYFFFFLFIFFIPNYLLHPDNYIMANPEVTPLHIVPEWYFLLFYGILRSIPNKILGIIALIIALSCIAFLPLFSQPLIRSGRFRPLFKLIFWLFVADCIFLSWSACNTVEQPFFEIGQIATIFYFLFFICFIPAVNMFEHYAFYREYKAKFIRKQCYYIY
jgi:quinol-cytochrome oxidoreductase complex cytochrome b subunit